MAYSPVMVSNNLLQRAFDEGISVSPMKLQKLLFFVVSEYSKRTGSSPIDDQFSPWQYGPVVRSVYDEFRPYAGQGIRTYGKDAKGIAYIIDESTDQALRDSLNAVWSAAKALTAVELSRLTHHPDSAWADAYGKVPHIPEEAVKDDVTYYPRFGFTPKTPQ